MADTKNLPQFLVLASMLILPAWESAAGMSDIVGKWNNDGSGENLEIFLNGDVQDSRLGQGRISSTTNYAANYSITYQGGRQCWYYITKLEASRINVAVRNNKQSEESCLRGPFSKIQSEQSNKSPTKWTKVDEVEKIITTANHHCSSNCRGEPTRTGYQLDIKASPSTNGAQRRLSNPKLECISGPCNGWLEITMPARLGSGGQTARAAFDVWANPTTWKLSADLEELE